MQLMKSNHITFRLQHSFANTTLALSLLFASSLLVPSAIAGKDNRPGIAPPESHPYGQSMAEWLSDFTQWKYGGSEADNTDGKVLFLSPLLADVAGGSGSLEDPVIFVGEGDITVKAGTAILDVLIAWWGEVYPDGSVDPVLPDDWWGTYVTGEIILDGKTVLDDVAAHYIPPVTLDPPILYSEPTPWGTIGTAYVQGVPILLRPLSIGVHTYVQTASVLIPGDDVDPDGTGIIFRNSRTITVVP
jgi:hypothetical protein